VGEIPFHFYVCDNDTYRKHKHITISIYPSQATKNPPAQSISIIFHRKIAEQYRIILLCSSLPVIHLHKCDCWDVDYTPLHQ